MAKPPSPSQLADFEILHRLGAGGMAEVFLAKKRGAEGTFKLLVVKRILAVHGAPPPPRSPTRPSQRRAAACVGTPLSLLTCPTVGAYARQHGTIN